MLYLDHPKCLAKMIVFKPSAKNHYNHYFDKSSRSRQHLLTCGELTLDPWHCPWSVVCCRCPLPEIPKVSNPYCREINSSSILFFYGIINLIIL